MSNVISVKQRYQDSLSDLKSSLGISNVMALPKLEKVTLNVGTGRLTGNKDMLTFIEEALRTISGQKAIITKAKKSIAGFKLREGSDVGFKVTLRGPRMVDFLDRLINITLPQIRDFKGIDQKSFDRGGNLTIGFKDSSAFVELEHAGIEKSFGLSITLSITSSDSDKSLKLISTLGFPLKQG